MVAETEAGQFSRFGARAAARPRNARKAQNKSALSALSAWKNKSALSGAFIWI
jgi:hypothetical protein